MGTDTTTTFSDFLRDPKGVVRKMEEHGGRLTIVRRSDSDLRLSDARQDQSAMDALLALTQLLALGLDDETLSRLVKQLTVVFPWIELLPESKRPEFVADFINSARGGLSVGQVGTIVTTLSAWKDTAIAYGDPDVRADGSDLHYFEVPELVDDPRADSE